MESKNKKLIIAGVIYALLFLLIVTAANIGVLNEWLGGVLLILRPLIIGLVIAYLCNPIFVFFERHAFRRIRRQGGRRGLSLLCTYLVLFLIFVLLLLLIIPQLVNSIVGFLNDYDVFLSRTLEGVNGLISWLNGQLPPKEDGSAAIRELVPEEVKEKISAFLASFHLDRQTLLSFFDRFFVQGDGFHYVWTFASNLVSLVTDIIFGLFISFYFLVSKEKRYAQVMRLRKAFCSDEVNARITRFCETADRSFGGFIRGKMLDSSMVGLMTYIVISFLRIDYAILIAVIIGVTDFIPVIGPFIGVIPSAVIILLADPTKVIPFLLAILIIQQIDGNIVAPKILGDNTGVSSLCVMIAITTMGSLWGLIGMVLGVPLFATILELTGIYLDKRLEAKGLPLSTESYYAQEIIHSEEEPPKGLLRRFTRKGRNLERYRMYNGTGDLSRLERIQLDLYALARKNRIFSDSSDDETLAEFAAEASRLRTEKPEPEPVPDTDEPEPSAAEPLPETDTPDHQ